MRDVVKAVNDNDTPAVALPPQQLQRNIAGNDNTNNLSIGNQLKAQDALHTTSFMKEHSPELLQGQNNHIIKKARLAAGKDAAAKIFEMALKTKQEMQLGLLSLPVQK